MRVGGDIDDARRRAGFEAVEQKLGQQEFGEMVERPGLLEALGGHLMLGENGACIVHENVEPGIGGDDGRRQAPHLGLQRQIGDEMIDLRIARLLGDPGGRLAAALLVAPDDHDMRAHPGEAQRGLLADAERRAGDETGFSAHFLGHGQTSSKAASAISPTIP